MSGGRDGQGPSRGEVFFEFTRIGAQVRVAAIDEPAHATQLQMRDLALAKLRRRLQNQS